MLKGCKDHEIHKLRIEHLTEEVDKGFEKANVGVLRKKSKEV